MTENEFMVQMNRISDCFGKEHYNNATIMQMIWSYVKDSSYSNLAAIVNHFIATARKAPLPIDFKDAMSAESRIHTGALEKLKAPTKCYKCQDIGSIHAWRLNAQFKHCSTYSFKCPDNCPASQQLSPKIQRWNQILEKEYFPVFGLMKTPDEIWHEKHEEFYGFPVADRTPKSTKKPFEIKELTESAVDAIQNGIGDVLGWEEVDVLPF